MAIDPLMKCPKCRKAEKREGYSMCEACLDKGRRAARDYALRKKLGQVGKPGRPTGWRKDQSVVSVKTEEALTQEAICAYLKDKYSQVDCIDQIIYDIQYKKYRSKRS